MLRRSILLLIPFLTSLFADPAPFDGSEQLSALGATLLVDGSSFTEKDGVWHVEVPAKGKNMMQVGLSVQNRDPITQGDPIRIVLTASGTAKDGSAAQIWIKTQPNERPWPNYTWMNQALTPEPVEYETVLSAPRDFAPGEFGYVLFCAEKAQSLQLHSLKLYAGNAVETVIEETQLYLLDMEEAFAAVTPPEDIKSSITGALPAGVTEDSHWADVDVAFSRINNASRGEGALRWELKNVRNGYSQLMLDQFPGSSEVYLKIRLAVRTPTSSTLHLGIREPQAPFKAYWETTTSGSPEWGVREFLVPPLPDDPTSQLILYLKQPGLMEIDDLEIVSIPKEQMEASQSAEGNLLPHSSFPFGFHRPWRGNMGESRGFEHRTDPSVIGPSGAPALKILGTGIHQFVRVPFRGKPGNNHTASLWVKSSKPTRIHPRIGPPSEQLWTGDWENVQSVGTEWTRIENTTFLPYHADGFYELQVYFRHNEVVWVDGLMVEVADEASEFERSDPVEVTLMPISDDHHHNLFFPDETMGIDCGLFGDVPDGSVLELTTSVFDRDGTETTRKIPLSIRELPVIRLTFPEADTWPDYGSYYVQARVLDADGRPLSRLHETMLHRVRRPRHWGEQAPNSPFGVHVSRNPWMIHTAKRLGFNWVRSFDLRWSRIQPNPEEPYNWEPLDALVNMYRENHLEVLGIFCHPPLWANMSNGEKIPGAGWKLTQMAIPDERLHLWADYAASMAARYEDTIKIYETWNEPFLAGFFVRGFEEGKPLHASPERLFKMTKAVRERLDKDGIEVDLAWNMGVHYAQAGKFERGGAELGMFDLVDLATYHSYERSLGGYPGDRYEDIIRIEKDFLKEFGREKFRVMNSEGGPGGGHQHNVFDTIPIANVSGLEPHYMKYHVRAWNSMLANGVERYFLYQLMGGGFWRGDYDLMQPDGNLGPNLLAISNMAWHLEDKIFQEILPLDGTFHAYLYEGKDSVAVALIPRAVGVLSLPEDLPKGWAFTDLIGNPVKGSQRQDFWLYAEDSSARKVRKWLTKNWGPKE